MKLTDEERNSLVILQLEKAKVFLKQADEMFDLKYWDIASNRYYYACFHAVQALLIQNGLSCKTHDGLIACFGLNFIKTGKISARLGSFLARMEQLRQKGDYNCIYSISEDEISTIKAPARELIETIEVFTCRIIIILVRISSLKDHFFYFFGHICHICRIKFF